MKKIGILCAGDQELAPFLPFLKNQTVSHKAMLTFYSGNLQNMEVVALYSGVCKTNASIAAQILLDTYGCEALINAGTAGGMDEKLSLFDTVISTETAYWDVSEDVLTEFHPWMKSIYFQADEKLLQAAKDTVAANPCPSVYFGRMLTGESFIVDENREEINRSFSPLCVDMETASIAHVCYVNKIPFLAVRTITDTADHSGTDEFDANCDKASEISAGIVNLLLKNLSENPAKYI